MVLVRVAQPGPETLACVARIGAWGRTWDTVRVSSTDGRADPRTLECLPSAADKMERRAALDAGAGVAASELCCDAFSTLSPSWPASKSVTSALPSLPKPRIVWMGWLVWGDPAIERDAGNEVPPPRRVVGPSRMSAAIHEVALRANERAPRTACKLRLWCLVWTCRARLAT